MSDHIKNSPADMEILDYARKAVARYSKLRIALDRSFYRSFLFKAGIQWLKWDGGSSTFSNAIEQKKEEPLLGRVTTNRFGSIGDTLASVLSRIEPNFLCSPADDTPESVTAAQTATILEPHLLEEMKIGEVRESLCSWLTYTGNAFIYPDVQQHGDNNWRLFADVVSPFEVLADMTIERIDDQPCVIIMSGRPAEAIQYAYNLKDKPRGQGLLATSGEYMGLHYLRSLAYISAASAANLESSYFGASDLDTDDMVTVKRIFISPNAKWPEGLQATLLDDRVLESAPLRKIGGVPKIPLYHAKFVSVPGVFFGRTPMMDILSLQKTRNKLEAIMLKTSFASGFPIITAPQGTRLSTNKFSPMAFVEYENLGNASATPRVWPGQAIASSTSEYMDRIDSMIDELSGVIDSLRGTTQNISGTPAALIETQIERGLSKFGPSFRSISETYRLLVVHAIELFKEFGVTPKIVNALGPDGSWRMQKFVGADFAGSINVVVDSDSEQPRSKRAEEAALFSAINGGIIDVRNPKIAKKLRDKLGLNGLEPELEKELDQISREHEMMTNGQTPPVLPLIENYDLHLEKHRVFFMQNEDEGVRARVMEHITNTIKAQAMEPMQIQMITGVPPPMPMDEGGEPEQKGAGGLLPAFNGQGANQPVPQ